MGANKIARSGLVTYTGADGLGNVYSGWGWNQTAVRDHLGEWWIATGHGLLRFPAVARAEALDGGAPMSPELARRVVELFREFRPAEAAGCRLTPHETRLLQMLVNGHNYHTAAAELGVSVNTVRFHFRNIYDKLQVHSKSEAVSKALRHRIVR